jgi:glutamate--cysteine ligase
MTWLPPERFAGLRDAIGRESFTPQRHARRAVGAEVEFLVHDDSGRPLPLAGPRGLVALLRRYADRAGWRELSGYDGIPRFEIPSRAIVSFEPGGQLEISSSACETASSLVTLLRGVVDPLHAALRARGVTLRSVGIDPFTDAREIPLQLPVERYEKMTRYFDRIGVFGVRMMRQTAAMQLSFDRGREPQARWGLLNDLAPYLVAVFANSAQYCGNETGHRSYRAHCWRMLDPTRTGVPAIEDGDPAASYARFALSANDMMCTNAAQQYQPFAAWLASDASESALERWPTHLTTLFPEVRPRGHFEVRSCDAVDPMWYAAPIVFLCGLLYDETAACEASVLASESRVLLRLAGEQGLRDPAIARTARDLFQLALAGARRLGPGYVGGEDIAVASDFYAMYTSRDRSPADDRPLVGELEAAGAQAVSIELEPETPRNRP